MVMDSSLGIAGLSRYQAPNPSWMGTCRIKEADFGSESDMLATDAIRGVRVTASRTSAPANTEKPNDIWIMKQAEAKVVNAIPVFLDAAPVLLRFFD